MDEQEFTQAADAMLGRIEAALEDSGADIDVELREGGVLELEFANGSKIIVNRHGAAREIWVAAKSGGYHYRWVDGNWQDTKGQDEFFATLSRNATLQAGQALRFFA